MTRHVMITDDEIACKYLNNYTTVVNQQQQITDPDGAVAKLSANGLAGIGFASGYQRILRAGY